jgi:NRPS condensation-like uncharacterized protein
MYTIHKKTYLKTAKRQSQTNYEVHSTCELIDSDERKKIDQSLNICSRNIQIGTQPGVNFTNIFWEQWYQFPFANKKYNLYFKHKKKVLRETFVQKSRSLNIGEIDSWEMFRPT